VKKDGGLDTEIRDFQSALAGSGAVEGFLNTASPGVIAVFQPNDFYPDHATYIGALAEAMKTEYDALYAAGVVLQIDCPDLAMGRHIMFSDESDEAFIANAELQVEALNHALSDVPAEACRLHLCWGNYEGPHTHDIGLEKIIDVVLKAKPAGILFEASNPRHAHEWEVWRDAKLPDDKVLIPGVIDSATNFVEHPRLVAQRIQQYADIVGRERVIAGVDCGFATFAGFGKIDPAICTAKLKTLAEGAAIATDVLY
jgi:5-methyltetrahydropteroyltriglutamate--homocysteine methyltransferase